MYGAGDLERRVSALIDKLGDSLSLSTKPIKDYYYYAFSAVEPVDIEPDTGEWFGQASFLILTGGHLPNSFRNRISASDRFIVPNPIHM
jgi:hypothetical protein